MKHTCPSITSGSTSKTQVHSQELNTKCHCVGNFVSDISQYSAGGFKAFARSFGVNQRCFLQKLGLFHFGRCWSTLGDFSWTKMQPIKTRIRPMSPENYFSTFLCGYLSYVWTDIAFCYRFCHDVYALVCGMGAPLPSLPSRPSNPKVACSKWRNEAVLFSILWKIMTHLAVFSTRNDIRIGKVRSTFPIIEASLQSYLSACALHTYSRKCSKFVYEPVLVFEYKAQRFPNIHSEQALCLLSCLRLLFFCCGKHVCCFDGRFSKLQFETKSTCSGVMQVTWNR